MNKVIRDGCVAVLFSPGFGAGWYSWNQGRTELLFDPAMVELVEAEQWEELQAYVTLKYPDIYTGGLRDLQITWVPQGLGFRIEEYDGSETVEIQDQVVWIIA